MNSRVVFLLSVCWLGVNHVHAQLNESDTLKFQLKASVTGNYQTGNVDALTLRGKMDALEQVSRSLVFKTQNNGVYQAFFDTKADQDIFSRNYVYYKPQRKLYPYGIAYISTNYRLKIDSRFFVGGGVTYQVVRKKNSILKLSANVVHEQTRFATSTYNDDYYNGTNKIELWRATAFASGYAWLAKRSVRVYYDAYWQPALSRTENYRVMFDIGFEFPVWKGLALQALYVYTNENVVPIKIKSTDSMLTFGVSYSKQVKNKA